MMALRSSPRREPKQEVSAPLPVLPIKENYPPEALKLLGKLRRQRGVSLLRSNTHQRKLGPPRQVACYLFSLSFLEGLDDPGFQRIFDDPGDDGGIALHDPEPLSE